MQCHDAEKLLKVNEAVVVLVHVANYFVNLLLVVQLLMLDGVLHCFLNKHEHIPQLELRYEAVVVLVKHAIGLDDLGVRVDLLQLAGHQRHKLDKVHRA